MQGARITFNMLFSLIRRGNPHGFATIEIQSLYDSSPSDFLSFGARLCCVGKSCMLESDFLLHFILELAGFCKTN